MIELTPLARPYAKATFDTAVELGKSDEVYDDLKIMAEVSQEKGFIKTIENPTLSKEELEKTVISIFEESITETSKKLLWQCYAEILYFDSWCEGFFSKYKGFMHARKTACITDGLQ